MNKPLWSWKHVFRKLGLRFRNEDAAYTSNENLDYRPLMAPEALEERRMLTGSGFNADFPDNSIEDSTLFEPETTVLFAPATTVEQAPFEVLELPVATEVPLEPTAYPNPETPIDPSEGSDPSQPDVATTPDTTTSPITPINPGDPFYPESPVITQAPDDPNGPASPEPPSDPSGPTDPIGPEGPANPGEPDDPFDPEGPLNPDGPSDPEPPSDPSGPKDPVGPEGPANPGEPGDPFDPEGPLNSDGPSDPDAPSDPNGPKDPAGPEGPANPGEPGDPFDPEGPLNPDGPLIPPNGGEIFPPPGEPPFPPIPPFTPPITPPPGGPVDPPIVDHHCQIPHHPEGELDAIDDFVTVIDVDLASGGPQSIHVLENDIRRDISPLEHSLTINANEYADTVPVRNAPEGYYLNFYKYLEGTGTYDLGSFSFDAEYRNYYNNTIVQEHAHGMWIGELTLTPNDFESTTRNVVIQTCTSVDYLHDDFGQTVGYIVDISSYNADDYAYGIDPNFLTEHAAFLITFDTFDAVRVGQDSATFEIDGEISSRYANIAHFTQPEHGQTSLVSNRYEQRLIYEPFPDTDATKDSFDYTIANAIGQSDTAEVMIEARPDVVSISAEDSSMSEVPEALTNKDYDTATFRISRAERDDDLEHDTIVYFTVSGREADPEPDRLAEPRKDWRSVERGIAKSVGYRKLEDGVIDWVYATTIKAGEDHVDLEIFAVNDSDWEHYDDGNKNETVVFMLVDEFEKKINGKVFKTRARYSIDAGKNQASAEIIDKTAELRINEYSSDEEDDPGVVVQLNSDDDNRDGVPDFYNGESETKDDDLVKVSLIDRIPFDLEYEKDYFTLRFDNSVIRLWHNATKEVSEKFEAAEISSETIFEEGSYQFYVEGVQLKDATVELVWHKSHDEGHKTFVFDTFKVLVWGIDVDIDSDNNGSIGHSQWEEELESSKYGLGKLILPESSELSQPVPIAIQIPSFIGEENTKVKISYQRNSSAGSISIYREKRTGENKGGIRDGGDYVATDIEYTLKELGYDSKTSTITLWVYGEDETKIKTWFDLQSLGQPQEFIEVTLITQEMPEAKDKVKYLVAGKPDKSSYGYQLSPDVDDKHSSIFWALQEEPQVRASLAAEAVYLLKDLPNAGLRILLEDDLKEMGIASSVISMLNKRKDNVPNGFTAALYRDYIAGPKSYMISYAGTNPDKLEDWVNNIGQIAADGSPQYNTAMVIASNLKRKSNEYGIDTLAATGHSLGGGMASAASVWAGIRAFTFNAAGLSRKTIELKNKLFHAEKEVWNNESLERFDAAARGYTGKDDGTHEGVAITAYYNKLDILSVLQDADNFLGDIVSSAIGRRIMVYGEYQSDPNTLLAMQFLDEIVPALVKKHGDDIVPNTSEIWKKIREKGVRLALGWLTAEIPVEEIKLLIDIPKIADGTLKMVTTHSLFVPALLGNLHGE
ncbi:hypothetical protein OAF56_01970 [Pirellulaceae bacterium]|nr:hypothetical protein [Pirellulaceae bacterium]